MPRRLHTALAMSLGLGQPPNEWELRDCTCPSGGVWKCPSRACSECKASPPARATPIKCRGRLAYPVHARRALTVAGILSVM
mmetsp:Transcript_60013/g.82450  ORF Transcript_60013/g.82450 Transcript_60013/m.82450 type:complete len:82 (+) Transcript_60013:400-645(+)